MKKKANRKNEAFFAWGNDFHKEVRALGFNEPIDDDHIHFDYDDGLTPKKAAIKYINSIDDWKKISK